MDEDFSGMHLTPVPRKGSPGLGRAKSYKQICISMYNEDLKQVDEMVYALKTKGVKANRSALIRHALSLIVLDDVPREVFE